MTQLEILKKGGVGIIATDTLYGLVGQALNPTPVAKIYALKERDPLKPFIVLISHPKDLIMFGIRLEAGTKIELESYWPGPVSVILECKNSQFEYLHRGTETLAFRQPGKTDLLELLKKTGPLVAPSANPESLPPAKTISEAKTYFGDRVDFYSEGDTGSKPSKVIKVTASGIEVIRD